MAFVRHILWFALLSLAATSFAKKSGECPYKELDDLPTQIGHLAPHSPSEIAKLKAEMRPGELLLGDDGVAVMDRNGQFRSLDETPKPLTDYSEVELEQIKHSANNYETFQKVILAQLKKQGYTELEPLGTGGFSFVYKGKNPKGEWVVLKFSQESKHDRLASDEASFLDDLAAATRGNRSPYAKSNGVVKAGSTPVLETQLIGSSPTSDIPASTLESKLDLLFGPAASRRHATETDALRESVLHQIADGLQIAHNEGIINRDLKPLNLLIDEGNHIYFIDLGLAARELGKHPEATGFAPYNSSSSDFAGTPTYASPNHLNGMPAEPKDDLYALRMIAAETRLSGLSSNVASAYRFERGPKKKPIKDISNAVDFPGMDRHQRLLAMSEWSDLPSTIPEWKEMRDKAEHLSETDFMNWYGNKLRDLKQQYHGILHNTRKAAAVEVLGSRFAIEHLGTGEGMLFQDPKVLEEVVKGAMVEYELTHPNGVSIEPDITGPQPYLLFYEFFERVTELHRQGQISDDVYQATVKKYSHN